MGFVRDLGSGSFQNPENLKIVIFFPILSSLLIIRKMLKTVLKIVVSIKSYMQKNDFYFVFFGLGPMVHMDKTKNPILLKIRLLELYSDYWRKSINTRPAQ